MSSNLLQGLRQDPVLYAKFFWPNVSLYSKQREILYSVRDNTRTFVHAGNELGKDFIAALCVLWFYTTRYPCRVITTSADYAQLEAVLWGELRRFIQESTLPIDRNALNVLDSEKGGPLLVHHLHIRTLLKDGSMCPLSYLRGRVAAKGEGMLGHHIASVGDDVPRTLFLADEASGVEDVNYDRAQSWADRMLIIGNPFPPSVGKTFFFQNCTAGDLRV